MIINDNYQSAIGVVFFTLNAQCVIFLVSETKTQMKDRTRRRRREVARDHGSQRLWSGFPQRDSFRRLLGFFTGNESSIVASSSPKGNDPVSKSSAKIKQIIAVLC